MHQIYYRYYDENVNKSSVEEKLNRIAKEEGDGGYGLGSPIRWLGNVIYENLEVAQENLEKEDSGWYDQLAVKYYEYPNLKKSKVLENLETRLKEWEKKLYDLEHKIHYANVKSQFISCPNCESKIRTSFIKWNNCPICHTDLRPKTTLDTISRYKEIIKDLEKQRKEEMEKLQKKQRNNAKIKWLVKIEFHC